MQALIISLFLLLSLQAFSQNEQHPSVKLELTAATFNCELASMVAGELSSFSPMQIKEQIDQTERILEENILNEANKRNKKVFKKTLKLLRNLKEINSNTEASKLKNEFCLLGSKSIRGISKGVINSAVIINMSVSHPLRIAIEFIKGLKTGEDSSLEILPFQDIVGDRKSLSLSMYLAIKSIQTYSASNPLLAPLMASPLIQASVQKFCRDTNSLREDDANFCKKIDRKIKSFLTHTKSFREKGAKLKPKESIDIHSWKNEVTDENLCSYLHNLRQSRSSLESEKQTREALVANLNPELMAYPEFNELESLHNSKNYKDIRHVRGLRNVIISLSPSADKIKTMISSGSWDTYLYLKNKLGKQVSIYNKLYRSSNLEKCERIKSKKKFSLIAYNKLKIDLNKFTTESLYEQHLLVKKQVDRINKKFNLQSTKLQWELISYGDLNMIHKILSSRDISNVVLIAHSSSEFKKIIDVNMNQVPTSFFSTLSPTIMSLSFYTCHSHNITETYDLKSKLKNQFSYFPKRFLNFVKPNEILAEGETPLMGLEAYLRRLDRELALQLEENLLEMTFLSGSDEYLEQKTCNLKIGNFSLQSGSLSLILNKSFLGQVKQNELNRTFSFPCHLLKEKNTLLLQNNSLQEKIKLEELPRDLNLNGEVKTTLVWKNFFDINNSFQGSKIEFNY